MQGHFQPSVFDRSPLVRLGRWLFSWRVLRRLLIGLAWTATVIALFYGVENWRGHRAWSKYQRESEARGEQLDYTTFIPQPVPDDQNFAATPLVRSWFVQPPPPDGGVWQDNFSKLEGKITSPKPNPDKFERRFVNLVAWEMAITALRANDLKRKPGFSSDKVDRESRARAASTVLQEFKTNEAAFAELRAAAGRSSTRYPVKYDLENPWAILLPHLANIKDGCRRLRVKACAELAAGHSENALADVLLGLHLADSLKDEPFLISYLVRISCLQLMIQPIWEALAEHRCSEAQLQPLQTRLQQFDLVSDMKRPLDAEQAVAILIIETVRKTGNISALTEVDATETISSPPSTWTLANVLSRIMPRGWYYQEQLNYCRLFQGQIGAAFDASNRRVSPSQSKSANDELERMFAGGRLGQDLNALLHHHVGAAYLLPSLTKVDRRAATAQTTTDQAALACALERYRLANGQFPETIAALVPRFISRLPHDVLTGEPYKYLRKEAAFTLYSVGWNEKDDGGVPGKAMFDDKEGDWVWQYPGN